MYICARAHAHAHMMFIICALFRSVAYRSYEPFHSFCSQSEKVPELKKFV